jgi:hypothetical protein
MTNVIVAFFFVFEKKKTMVAFVTFFESFAIKKGNNNCYGFFRWFCSGEGDGSNVVAFFYGGGVVKKAMVTSCHCLFFPFSLVLLVYFIKIDN